MRKSVMAVAVAFLAVAAMPLASGSDSAPGMDPDGPLVFGVYPKNFTLTGPAGLRDPGPFPDAMQRTRAISDGPVVVHTYAGWRWWAGEKDTLAQLVDEARGLGLSVNLALRFVPPEGHETDVAGFVDFVTEAVQTFPPETGVVHFQITNEANVGVSPDSDGYYSDAAVQALVDGVIAAKSVAGAGQAIGFNWFYRLPPDQDQAFFDRLGAAPQAFREALDWVGLDVYPGTYWPPPGSDPYTSVVDAVRYLSRQLMPRAGLEGWPIFIQETGWPDLSAGLSTVADPLVGPLPYPEALEAQPRSRRAQAEAARAIVQAVRTTHCTDNVRLAMWFPLFDDAKDAGDGWGLLRGDGTPKPSYHAFSDEVRAAQLDRC